MDTFFLDPTAVNDGISRLGLGSYESLVGRLRECGRPLATDVYALQQVVYRHHLAGDAEFGRRVAGALRDAMAEVYPVTEEDLVLARWLGEEDPRLEARERLHLAVIRRHGLRHLVTGVPERYRRPRGIDCISIRSLLVQPDAADGE